MKKNKAINRITGLILIAAMAGTLTGCFSESATDDETDGALKAIGKAVVTTEEGEVTAEGDVPVANLHNSYIKPLEVNYNASAPGDCTVKASFTIKDFDTENNTLTFTAYAEELYDAAEIALMQIGDTIYMDGKEYVVESIQDKNGDLIVNGGFEEGGVELTGGDGGTYKAHGFDDYATYEELGKSTLTFSEELSISDAYKDMNNPETYTFEDIEKFLKGLTGAADSFTYASTSITIAGGQIVNITRNWIP